MKKNFVIPNIKVENFHLENIVLKSGEVPTNVGTAKATLADEHNVSVNKMAVITL